MRKNECYVTQVLINYFVYIPTVTSTRQSITRAQGCLSSYLGFCKVVSERQNLSVRIHHIFPYKHRTPYILKWEPESKLIQIVKGSLIYTFTNSDVNNSAPLNHRRLSGAELWIIFKRDKRTTNGESICLKENIRYTGSVGQCWISTTVTYTGVHLIGLVRAVLV